jgi:putative ABC transport system permease protein
MIAMNFIRLLRKGSSQRFFIIINLIGLTVSLTAAMLIFLFVQNETSYDRFWVNTDKIARLETVFTPAGRDDMVNVTAPGPAKAALSDYFKHEIVFTARINNVDAVISTGDQYYAEKISLVDPEIQDIFHFESLRGDVATALADIRAITLNENLAAMLFGDKDPIGQTLTINNNKVIEDYVVAAVMKDLPDNTHLAVQAMIPISETLYAESPWLFEWWFSVSNHTYFMLNDGYALDHIKNRLVAFVDQAFPDAGTPPSSALHFNTTALADIHLLGSGSSEMKPGGNINIVRTFSAIALLIILISSVNYINLATAGASLRAKEVVLKKVMGGSRRQLVIQLIGESLVLVTVAFLLALFLSETLLPAFNAVLDERMGLSLSDPVFVGISAVLVLFLGLATAFYPSWVISSYRPAQVLGSGRMSGGANSTLLRSSLVVFQFAVSIALMVATLAIYVQFQYFRTLDHGYDASNLLVVNNFQRDEARNIRDVFKQTVLDLPMVESAAFAGTGPGMEYVNNTGVRVPGIETAHMVSWLGVDHDFIKTYKIPLLAGRDYDEQRANDRLPEIPTGNITEFQQNIIVNQTFLKKVGFGDAETALGKTFSRRFSVEEGDSRRIITINFLITGVIRDVHMHSPRSAILPTIYDVNDNFFGSLVLRYRGNPSEVAEALENTWQELVPGIPFDYYFVEHRLAHELRIEKSHATMFAVFAFFAFAISSLGLFGLANFVAARRTKEIGIRKIMGARTSQVVRLLLWQFLSPVIIANLIAWPTAAWLVHRWLSQFPYRIDFSSIVPLAASASVLALLIAWLTIGSHAIKMARTNPVKSLRNE